MRKTARPVVWEGGGAQSPSLDPIQGTRPTSQLDLLVAISKRHNDIRLHSVDRGQFQDVGSKFAARFQPLAHADTVILKNRVTIDTYRKIRETRGCGNFVDIKQTAAIGSGCRCAASNPSAG